MIYEARCEKNELKRIQFEALFYVNEALNGFINSQNSITILSNHDR